MDTNAILSKLDRAAPGMILEKSRFGRSQTLAVWIEAKAIRAIADAASKADPFQLNWLENLSIAQVSEAFVVTYLLRSSVSTATLVLRSTIVPASDDAWMEVASVRDIWPMAEGFENDAAELFGIRFLDSEGRACIPATRLLPEGWPGFPMRKEYRLAGKKAKENRE